jgi:hypothetical protein
MMQGALFDHFRDAIPPLSRRMIAAHEISQL